MANFFDGFNENFCVPPACEKALQLDDTFCAGDGKVAIDYDGSLIGYDVWPICDGVELSGQPVQMENLAPAEQSNLLEVPHT